MKQYFELYSLTGFFHFILNVLRTRLFYAKAKIIRFPFDIRGGKFIDFAEGFTTGIGCRLEAYPIDNKSKVIHIGKNVQINDYVHITAMESVQIGNNVLMASKIYISDCTHGFYSGIGIHSHPDTPPMEREYSIKPVVIHDNVWIGESVSILPGVSIGKGSIIGSNSVVSKDIPEYSIAVGIPAKVVKKFNFETLKWEKV
jgi:lipopolysaccharide O-acetyltransferase